MLRYKVGVLEHHEEIELTYYADDEKELYKVIGGIMWDPDQEIVSIFRYAMEDDRVEKGEIEWNEENKRFFVNWETVWEG